MTQQFLELPPHEQAEILNSLAPKFGMSPAVLEKDVWVCWTLKALFSLPDAPKMAFKGGTSLSKAYNAIERFSEDVDVTVDHGELMPDVDPFMLSGEKRRKLIKDLLTKLYALIEESIYPAMQEAINSKGSVELDLDDSISKADMILHYPSCLETDGNSYVGSRVRVEFGGKNTTEPQEQRVITPYIAAEIPALVFPEARVFVLKGTRTFWEKITLIHAEINRGNKNKKLERFSRHWYDVYMLSKHDIGTKALTEDLSILKDVVKYKNVFFFHRDYRYEDCLNRAVRLVPPKEVALELEKDYKEMIAAKMFYDNPPTFAEILEQMRTLEKTINALNVG